MSSLDDQNDNVSNEVLQVWTIGHSTRSIEAFLEALVSENITALVDVRSFPSSRKFPHFNQRELSESLGAAGIRYVHMAELGGRRRALKDSHNTAWQNPGFRGYADYMETQGFVTSVRRLLEAARAGRTAIMCAEAIWWRCHRSLISDYLKSKGVVVTHILSAGKTEPHSYTSAASFINGELSYRGLF